MERWYLQGHEVTYEDNGHIYTVDGKVVPSVTQILHFQFPNKYNGVDNITLMEAAKKGTAMHQAIQDYEELGIETEGIEELRNYKFIKRMFGFEFVEAEMPILLEYKGKFAAGRLDQIIRIDDKLMVNDFKRTSVLDKDYLAYQLNMYRIAYQQTYLESIDGLRATWLRKEKRKFIELPINEDLVYELLERYFKEDK